MENVAILAIAETRIHESLPTPQFLLVGYYNHNSCLCEIVDTVSWLNFPYLPYKIQAISFKLKLKKGEINSNICI